MQRIISCIPRDKFAQALSKGPGELYLSIVASKLALVVGALGNEPVRDDARWQARDVMGHNLYRPCLCGETSATGAVLLSPAEVECLCVPVHAAPRRAVP